jgi:hypothetical protein
VLGFRDGRLIRDDPVPDPIDARAAAAALRREEAA